MRALHRTRAPVVVVLAALIFAASTQAALANTSANTSGYSERCNFYGYMAKTGGTDPNNNFAGYTSATDAVQGDACNWTYIQGLFYRSSSGRVLHGPGWVAGGYAGSGTITSYAIADTDYSACNPGGPCSGWYWGWTWVDPP